jgi:hypothetical protein
MTLFSIEKRWAKAILEGFAPESSPGLAPKPGEADFLGAHLRIYEASAPMGRLALRFGVLLAALSPIWLLRRFSTLDRLTAEERSEILGRLLAMRGPAGELTILLKMTASIALLTPPSIRARSGFDRISHARV